jgi:hypothetical protein
LLICAQDSRWDDGKKPDAQGKVDPADFCTDYSRMPWQFSTTGFKPDQVDEPPAKRRRSRASAKHSRATLSGTGTQR